MADPTPPSPPTKEQLRGAMKAFKKRLKLTQLDQDSKLGRNPATSGRVTGIVAIMPPDNYPLPVWDELVRLGKLKRDRHGLYEIVPE